MQQTLDGAITILLSWHTLAFGLGIYILTLITRRIVETASSKAKDWKWWRDVILPSLPVLLGGGIAAVATFYPFPKGVESFSARVFFGVVVGFMSGWIYRIIKGAISKKTGIELPDTTETAPKLEEKKEEEKEEEKKEEKE